MSVLQGLRQQVVRLTDTLVARWVVATLQTRGQKRAVETACPDDLTIAAFIDHQLPDKQQRQVEAHLAECHLCRKLVVLVLQSQRTVPDPPSARKRQ